MATAPSTETETVAPSSLAGKLRALVVRAIAAARENRKQALLFGSAGIVSLILMFVTLWVLLAYWGEEEKTITPAMTLAMLDAGLYPEAIAAAKALYEDKKTSFEDLGLVSYVVGLAGALQTDERWEKDKSRSYLVASRYLEEAQDRGFLPDRTAEGTYQLGRCQFLSAQYSACQPNLLAALKMNPERKTEIYRMLASAALAEADPRLDRALEFNAKYLESKLISIAARDAAWIERAQIYFRQGKIADCQEVLRNVAENSKLRGDAIVLEGRILMREAETLARAAQAAKPPAEAASPAPNSNAREVAAPGSAANAPAGTEPTTENDAAGPKPAHDPQVQSLYESAIARFKQAQDRDSLKAQATPKAMYLIGVCLHRLGRLEEARVQLDRTRHLFAEQAEGLAAGLEGADVLRALNLDSEAIAAYRRELGRIGTPDLFSNPWLTLQEFRQRITEAYRDYLAAGKFERSLELLEGYRPLFSRVETTQRKAEAHCAWGNKLAAEAAAARLPDSRLLQQKACRQYRHAGEAYLSLARLRSATREYPNDIWNSADNLLKGRDYRLAIRTFKEYLKIELRARRAQALVSLGKALLTVGQIKASIEAFQECLEFHPNDVAVFDARYWCSKAYQEQGDLDKAEQLLRLNLTGDTLTPASSEWRESLFELGRLLNGVGRYQEAIGYLNEAVARYPTRPQAIEAQYLVAESYREAARGPQERLASAEIESVRVAQTKQLRDLLEAALVNYKAVLELLNRREEESPLSPHEAAMLRNCYFSIGSVLFDMGRYQEAIKAYSNASTRYQNEPLVLEAFVQIANCHRRLHKPVEARGALEQAKVVWKRLPTNVDYSLTTNYSRDEWQKLLDLLGAL